jgi:hypothetical protein
VQRTRNRQLGALNIGSEQMAFDLSSLLAGYRAASVGVEQFGFHRPDLLAPPASGAKDKRSRLLYSQ